MAHKQLTYKILFGLALTVILSIGDFIFSSSVVQANGCDHLIGLDITKADGADNYTNVSPGDTVCIQAGIRDRLTLQNFEGTVDRPIVFINVDGPVIIDTQRSLGLQIYNSRFFRLTGTGTSEKYGIKIAQASSIGVKIGAKSQEFEIDHIEVSHVDLVGIMAKTKSTCSDGSDNYYDFDGDGIVAQDRDDIVNQSNFIQLNSVFHDNYIHHIGTEGFYIGSSFHHTGQKHDCKNGTEIVFDATLQGVWAYNNRIEHTGWNGLQVGSAVKDCYIYDNVIRYDSEKKNTQQDGGIAINHGSACEISRNFIKDGFGPGITAQGDGLTSIINNVIINAGRASSKGEMTGNGITAFKGEYYIWHNTIVSPKNIGIKFLSNTQFNHRIENNYVVSPGNGNDAYIDVGNRNTVSISNNLNVANINEAGFDAPSQDNYSLRANSPAVDLGISLNSWVTADYDHTIRPIGSGHDVGAFEFSGENTEISYQYRVLLPFVIRTSN